MREWQIYKQHALTCQCGIESFLEIIKYKSDDKSKSKKDLLYLVSNSYVEVVKL